MNNEYFKQFVEDRNLKAKTVDGYKVSINSYCRFNKMSVDELMNEALLDEKNRVLLKDRVIKKRLLSYRSFLIKRGMSHNTVKTYFSKIKTFYNHFSIELPKLPSVKYSKSYQLNYSDLPSRDDIAEVLNIVPLDFKALILFMSSSGTAKAETLSLTVGDFITACSDYYEATALESILNELNNRNDVVPTLYLRRIKTDKYYFTFCSSEASSYIVRYLKSRSNLSLEDKLFPFSSTLITSKFQKINDYMNWGRRGYYRFFRSHVLRKFHASNIGLAAEYVDSLQGRQKNLVHDAYIKSNPDMLKQLYVDHMNNVMIFSSSVSTQKVVEEIHVSINIFLSDMYISLD